MFLNIYCVFIVTSQCWLSQLECSFVANLSNLFLASSSPSNFVVTRFHHSSVFRQPHERNVFARPRTDVRWLPFRSSDSRPLPGWLKIGRVFVFQLNAWLQKSWTYQGTGCNVKKEILCSWFPWTIYILTRCTFYKTYFFYIPSDIWLIHFIWVLHLVSYVKSFLLDSKEK